MLFSPHIDHLVDLCLVVRVEFAEFAEESLLQNCISGLLTFIQQIIGCDLKRLRNAGQLFAGWLSSIAVFQLPDIALA